MISRREFGKYVGVGALGISLAGTGFTLGGCNLAQDIVNWEPIAANALASIQRIVTANGIIFSPVIQSAFNDVNAALVAMKAAAQEYLATTPPPVSTLDKLKAALQAVIDQFNTFFQQLNIPGGGLLNLVLALAQLVVGTILGFKNSLPGSGAVTMMAVHVGSSQINASAKARSKGEFKKDFNKALDGAQGVSVPKEARMHVSFFEHL